MSGKYIYLSEGCPLNGVIFFLGAMALGGGDLGVVVVVVVVCLPPGRDREQKKGPKIHNFSEKVFP